MTNSLQKTVAGSLVTVLGVEAGTITLHGELPDPHIPHEHAPEPTRATDEIVQASTSTIQIAPGLSVRISSGAFGPASIP
jgi:hypothetical protein